MRRTQEHLEELREILELEGDKNWIVGINAALEAIRRGGESGYADARSVYKTMSLAKNGFLDFYIQRTSVAEQDQANHALDKARENLWDLFEKSEHVS